MQFDIFTSARDGYVQTWTHREYLLKLATIPVLIKLICFFSAYALDVDQTKFSYPLMMLPAYFAEGWLIAQFLRTMITGETWPIKIEGDPEKHFQKHLTRARGILAAIITFVLISILHGGLMVTVLDMRESMLAQTQDGNYSGDPLMVFVGFAGIFACLWAFRLFWLNIPMLVLMPVKTYLKALPGLMPSLHMLATWLLAIIPLSFLLIFISGILLSSSGGSLTEAPQAITFIIITLNLLGELLTKVISSVAIASLLYPLFLAYGIKPVHLREPHP